MGFFFADTGVVRFHVGHVFGRLAVVCNKQPDLLEVEFVELKYCKAESVSTRFAATVGCLHI